MSEKYETPHVLTPVINPITENFSLGRILILASVMSLLTFEIFIFALTFVSVFTVLCPVAIIITIAIGLIFGRSEKAYNYHLTKICFKFRKFRGIEFIAKFSEDVTRYAVKSFTGWESINTAGLSKYTVNKQINWSLEKEFEGNWGFTLLAFPPAESDKKTYNQNLRDAAQALPYGCGEKDILISGQDMSFISDDITEMLQDPKISQVRKDELYSIQERFLKNEGYIDWIYLIHIMLPYTEYEEKATKKMQEVREGYERLLNDMGINTILIKDAEDMILIINGMLTGEMYWSGVNES